MRVNYYQPCRQAADRVVGLSPHADPNGLTLLLQMSHGDVQGLQVKKDGRWFAVRALDGAFVVNVADALEIVSNGLFRSIEHRAVIHPTKERISVALFHYPYQDRMLGPLPELLYTNISSPIIRCSPRPYTPCATFSAAIPRMGAHGASPIAPPPPLSIDTRRRDEAIGEPDDDGGEPLSPTARMFHDFYIVAVVGLGAPIDFDPARAGLEVTLVRHPRFTSIRVMDGPEPRWVRMAVNLDDHIIVPELDRAAISADPDRALEDYVASLSTLPMDQSRPLWELHVLDFPTSEAASAVAFRIHHALGDGASLVSLLLVCTRSAADPKAPPALPSSAPAPAPGAPRLRRPAAAGVVGGRPGARRVGPVLVRDPPTLFTGVKGVEARRKRFVMRTLSLDDVKLVKHALGCQLAEMMEPGKHNDLKWGNRLGYIVLPFEIVRHDDPLDYVRNAKTVDRKKHSFEAIATHAIAETVTKLFGVEALTVHWQGYMDTIKIILAVDDAQFPDSHDLLDDFAESLEMIRKAASVTSKAQVIKG
ncbi:O-acyltransferase WSD1-like [Panicum miliaceum]|uniref:O-acyltransferase WSD1-like n=1 Tax=Panicum miliaceum TaxID=4540 RepID=A0A3L6TMM7_PANMI|nr:O-acyltransferase WSD1-like [Panicum miliaceum]